MRVVQENCGRRVVRQDLQRCSKALYADDWRLRTGHRYSGGDELVRLWFQRADVLVLGERSEDRVELEGEVKRRTGWRLRGDFEAVEGVLDERVRILEQGRGTGTALLASSSQNALSTHLVGPFFLPRFP